MRIRPYGPEAWLVDEIADPVAWAGGLREADLEGVVEVVAAERTVLVRCDRSRHSTIGGQIDGVHPSTPPVAVEPVVIPVDYDGDDLDEVARRTGLSTSEVVDRHVGGVYTVRFCGFAPGFAYLGGLDRALELPRRESPRTRVPAGSVAIAAHYTAVYPAPSPGGWHLLGRTAEQLWDPASPTPSRLVPGTAVQFRDAGSR